MSERSSIKKVYGLEGGSGFAHECIGDIDIVGMGDVTRETGLADVEFLAAEMALDTSRSDPQSRHLFPWPRSQLDPSRPIPLIRRTIESA